MNHIYSFVQDVIWPIYIYSIKKSYLWTFPVRCKINGPFWYPKVGLSGTLIKWAFLVWAFLVLRLSGIGPFWPGTLDYGLQNYGQECFPCDLWTKVPPLRLTLPSVRKITFYKQYTGCVPITERFFLLLSIHFLRSSVQ